ncbi:uncharacterized protein ARMOST_18991 [Armillaria ostoyae]|uniref:Ribonuclease H1 N-terminal domain-containing protein n=1 Tax=Armillaria ostoyae TaxID=47428 RepID=A0A284S395_ARMOS|nr:uncharacterized protein ARMOST_18991 [Armillaria ostoyae]
MVSYERLLAEQGLYNPDREQYTMPPRSSEPSTESSLTMTEETMTATAVDVENEHPRSSNKPSERLKKKSDEPTIYIDLTTPPVSPKVGPVSQLPPAPSIITPALATRSESSAIWDTVSSLPDLSDVVDGPNGSLHEHGSMDSALVKPCGQPLSPFKPKYPPAPFPTAPRPLLPPSAPTPSTPKVPKGFRFHGVFPDDDNSSESCDSKSTQKADDTEPDLKKLVKSFSVTKAGRKRSNAFWVVYHGQVMGIYDDYEEAQKINESFCTAKTRGYPTLKAARGAWDHAWRNEKIAFGASGLSSANEADANARIQLYWVVIEGVTPGIHMNHADAMVAVGEDNPYLLRVT